MRHLPAFLLGVCTLVLAGCDSVPAHVRQRFAAPEPQVRTYESAERAVFDAAQVALRRMDFQVSRAGAAQGIINAISRIQPGATFGTGRQYTFEIRLRESEPQRTQVSVVLREQEESTSFAGATDIPLRQHALYDSFFSGVTQVLTERAKAPPAR